MSPPGRFVSSFVGLALCAGFSAPDAQGQWRGMDASWIGSSWRCLRVLVDVLTHGRL